MKTLRALFVGSLIFLPALSYASTLYFSPASVSVQPGQMVTLTVVVDPQGSAYTAKVAIAFPPNLLSVSSFSQASGWLPLTQPGYDSVDNSSGSLIKTGGMSGGLASAQAFGTVTFVAKAAGVANITVTGGTQILNSQSQNTFTGGGQATVNISAPQIVSPPVQPVSPKPKASPVRNLMQVNKSQTAASSTTTSTSTATTSSEASSLTALVGKSSFNPHLLLQIILPILTFLAGFFLGRRTKFPL